MAFTSAEHESASPRPSNLSRPSQTEEKEEDHLLSLVEQREEDPLLHPISFAKRRREESNNMHEGKGSEPAGQELEDAKAVAQCLNSQQTTVHGDHHLDHHALPDTTATSSGRERDLSRSTGVSGKESEEVSDGDHSDSSYRPYGSRYSASSFSHSASTSSQEEQLLSKVGQTRDGRDGRFGPLSSSESYFTDEFESGSTLQGVAGLRNLGNTCFMNSALQCLSHTEELVDYFMRGEHKSEINRVNPLGLKGELAEAFGYLMSLLWREDAKCVIPKGFKRKLSMFAPQFGGYNQHDSQELLAFLLDGLHEDLNRVKEKKYVEGGEDDDQRPEAVIAEETWAYHKARNDSIIVDHFQGMYKSTLECPNCKNCSVKFDPFMYLSVPLPMVAIPRSFKVLLVDCTGTKSGKIDMKGVTITVNSRGTVSDLVEELRKAHLKDADLILAEVDTGYIKQVLFSDLGPTQFNLSEKLANIYDDDEIVAYCIPKIEQEMARDRQLVNVVVYQRKAFNQQANAQWFPFGFPLMFVCKNTAEDITDKLSKYVTQEWEGLPEGSYRIGLTNKFGMETKELSVPECINIISSQIDCVPTIYFSIEWKDLSLVDESKLDFSYFFKPELERGETNSKRDSISLHDCLSKFTEKEKLEDDAEGYKCEKCKNQSGGVLKKLTIYKTPSILILHLKRFSGGGLSRFSRFSKNDAKISFGMKMDIGNYTYNSTNQPTTYRLFAISHHSGSLSGGHYWADAENQVDKKWYNFNDSMVTPCKQPATTSSTAYVLFYRKIESE